MPTIADRKGKHPAKRVHALVTEFLVQMNDNFRVAARAEDVALRLEELPQLAVVVDFTVEHGDYGAVFVEQRLIGTRDVDDAESPRGQ